MRAVFHRALPLIMRLLFVLFPLIANVAFATFSCYDFGRDEYQYLIADPSVECWTPRYYQREYRLAWTLIGLYLLGNIVLSSVLLYLVRHTILAGGKSHLSVSILFLYREYMPQYYWW